MPDIRTTDGIKIAYGSWGKRDGSPCLLIQGLGMDSRGWALQRGSFGRKHRCVAVDNRGTGASDAPEGPYDLLRMAEDAVAVLDAEGIDQAHVVGASMGGVIAQIIGVVHRERVSSLTLACTACHHHDWRRELLQQWADDVGERGMRAMVEDDGMRWLVGPRIQRRFGVWINVLARVLMQTKPEPFIAQVRAILDASDELRAELPAISVPTLVITGSQDTLTPVGDAEELAELIPASRLYVLSGAAHGLMAEAPMAFNDAVLRFLDEVDAARATEAAAPEGAAQEIA